MTWSLGANRVAAVAAEEGMLPAALGRLHPRFKTPYLAFVAMGVVSTVLLVGGALLSNSQSNIFWMTFRLTALCLLLCYLLVFPAFLVLRKTTARPAATVPPARRPRRGGDRRRGSARSTSSGRACSSSSPRRRARSR